MMKRKLLIAHSKEVGQSWLNHYDKILGAGMIWVANASQQP